MSSDSWLSTLTSPQLLDLIHRASQELCQRSDVPAGSPLVGAAGTSLRKARFEPEDVPAGSPAAGTSPRKARLEPEATLPGATSPGGASTPMGAASPKGVPPRKGGASPRPRANRKGTGFVAADDLPMTDEEEVAAEPSQAAAKQADSTEASGKKTVGFDAVPDSPTARTPSKATRKGTGFVATADIPLTDDEDEEEAPPAPPTAPPAAPGGSNQEAVPNGSASPQPDPPEQEPSQTPVAESGPAQRKVRMEPEVAEPGAGSASPIGAPSAKRKGTGFVMAGDLPLTDDEEDEEEPSQATAKQADDEEATNSAGKKNVDFTGVPESSTARTPSKAARKGTGFVMTADLPLTDEEDEEEQEVPPVSNAVPDTTNAVPDGSKQAAYPSKKAVDFAAVPEPSAAKTPAKAARKGTGFVMSADLPLTDEEDEEEAPFASHAPPNQDTDPSRSVSPQPPSDPPKQEGNREQLRHWRSNNMAKP